MGNDIWFQRGTAAHDLYVSSLNSQFANGYRVYDPSFALNNDFLAYQKIKRDADIWRAVEFRKRRVAGVTWNVEPSDESKEAKLHASIMESLLKKIRNFVSARATLAEAFLSGSKWAFIEGGTRILTLGDGKPRKWWVPTRLKNVSRLRFVGKPVHDDEGHPQIEWQFYSLTDHMWVPLEHPEWFVKLIYDDQEETFGYGSDLLSTIYTSWRAKEIALQEGLGGLMRWARGNVLVQVDGARDAENNMPNTAIVNNWLDVLEKMSSRYGLVFDKKDQVTVLTGGMEGHQIALAMLTYLRDSITRCIEFGVLPTGGGEDVGSNARAEVEGDTMESALQFDREVLSEALSQDLGGLTYRLNASNFMELGLGAVEPGKFSITHRKFIDPIKEAQINKLALESGMDLKKEEAYESIGRSMPNLEEDEVIEGHAPVTGLPGEDFELDAVGEREPGKKPEKPSQFSVVNEVKALLDGFRQELKAEREAKPAAPHQSITFGVPEEKLSAIMERVGGDMKTMGEKIAAKPTVVNVSAPIINVPVPKVTLEAPTVNVPPTVVHVAPAVPKIEVVVPQQPPPVVNVNLEPDGDKKIDFKRDTLGRITSAELKDKS